MADEDAQPAAAPEAPAAAPAAEEPKPAKAAEDGSASNVTEHDDLTKDDEPDTGVPKDDGGDIFDLLAGITPDKILNKIGFATESVVESGWTAAAASVNQAIKGMFKGSTTVAAKGDKGAPGDLPMRKDGGERSRIT